MDLRQDLVLFGVVLAHLFHHPRVVDLRVLGLDRVDRLYLLLCVLLLFGEAAPTGVGLGEHATALDEVVEVALFVVHALGKFASADLVVEALAFGAALRGEVDGGEGVVLADQFGAVGPSQGTQFLEAFLR